MEEKIGNQSGSGAEAFECRRVLSCAWRMGGDDILQSGGEEGVGVGEREERWVVRNEEVCHCYRFSKSSVLTIFDAWHMNMRCRRWCITSSHPGNVRRMKSCDAIPEAHEKQSNAEQNTLRKPTRDKITTTSS